VVWWSGVVALAFGVGAWARSLFRREPSWWSVPILGVASTWMPWLAVHHRPIFSFYAVASLPFMILAIALAFDAARNYAYTPRQQMAVVVGGGGLLVLSAIAAIYFWPVWTYGLMPYESWRHHMWFSSWV